MLYGRRIILGISGSIAAYKAAELARLLVREGAEVTAVMTPNACRFITPLTLRTLTGRPVASDLFSDAQTALPHIRLAQWAEAVVVAPATADLLARCAQGRADDLLSAVLLDTSAPVLWAPAMNTRMWENPLTRENVRRLAACGHRFVEPQTGALACEDSGKGRLASLPEILSSVRDLLQARGSLSGKKILITAGPTREPWDAVRFFSNRSSGRMGYALAAECQRRGAEVTLLSGPVTLDPPEGVRILRVTTAREMHQQAREVFPGVEAVIAAAAVADYRPAETHPDKLKKQNGRRQLELERNPDILEEMGRQKNGRVLVGFAAETDEDPEPAGREKLRAKNLDLIVVNRASGPEDAFGSEETSALLLDAAGQRWEIPRQPKTEIARLVIDRLENLLDRKPT